MGPPGADLPHPLGPLPPAGLVPPGPMLGEPPPPDPIVETASRLLQKEILAIQRASVEQHDNPQGFAQWAQQFFDTLAPVIAQTLSIEPEEAKLYCDTQRDDLLVHGMGVITSWTPEFLISLAQKAASQDPMTKAMMAMVKKPSPPINVQVHPSQVHVTNEAPKPASKTVTLNRASGPPLTATVEEHAA